MSKGNILLLPILLAVAMFTIVFLWWNLIDVPISLWERFVFTFAIVVVTPCYPDAELLIMIPLDILAGIPMFYSWIATQFLGWGLIWYAYSKYGALMLQPLNDGFAILSTPVGALFTIVGGFALVGLAISKL